MKLQGGKFGEWSRWLVKIVLAYPSSCVLCWLMLVSTTVFFCFFFTSDISEQADCNNRSGEPLHSQKCWKRNDKHAPGLTPHQICCLWVKKLDSPIENCSVIDGGFCSLFSKVPQWKICVTLKQRLMFAYLISFRSIVTLQGEQCNPSAK